MCRLSPTGCPKSPVAMGANSLSIDTYWCSPMSAIAIHLSNQCRNFQMSQQLDQCQLHASATSHFAKQGHTEVHNKIHVVRTCIFRPLASNARISRTRREITELLPN